MGCLMALDIIPFPRQLRSKSIVQWAVHASKESHLTEQGADEHLL